MEFEVYKGAKLREANFSEIFGPNWEKGLYTVRDMSGRGNIRSWKCPSEIYPMAGMPLMSEKCPVGEMSIRELSVGEVSGRGSVRRGSVRSGKCPSGMCPSGMCPGIEEQVIGY